MNINDDYDRRRRCVKKEKEETRDFFQCSLSQSLVVLIDQRKEDDDDVLIGRWFGREAARSQAKSRSKRRMGISCRLHPRTLISRHLTFSSLLFFFFHFNGLNDNQRKKKGPEQINNKRQNKTKQNISDRRNKKKEQRILPENLTTRSTFFLRAQQQLHPLNPYRLLVLYCITRCYCGTQMNMHTHRHSHRLLRPATAVSSQQSVEPENESITQPRTKHQDCVQWSCC